MEHVRAEEILRKSLETVANEQNYDDPDFKVTVISTGGANYTSLLFESTISSKGKDDLELFAKVAAVGEKMRAQAPMRVFDVERIFYTELLKHYRQLEDKHGVLEHHRFQAPKIYACSPTEYEETVVMENLSKKGYALHNRFESVDWNYAAASFTELAKLHALSMALKRYNPEEYQRYVAEFKFQLDELNNSEMGSIFENMMKKAMEAATKENKERLGPFLEKTMGQGGLDEFMKYFLPGDSPCIRHGDFRPSNLMHKVKEDGTVDIIVVDFQTLVTGTPVIDLFYFIFLGTDKAFRNEHFDQLLAHYYKELKAAMSRLGLNPDNTYSKQKFDDDVKENLSYGIVLALTSLVLVCVETADAPDLSEDTGLSSMGDMKPGAAFADRLNGILDNFIEWGIL